MFLDDSLHQTLLNLSSKGSFGIGLSEATSLFDKYTEATQKAGFSVDNYFNRKLSKGEKILQEYSKSLGDASGSAEELAERSADIASNLNLESLKGFGFDLLKSAAVMGFGYLIEYMITAKQRTKELADEIKNTYETNVNTISSNTDTINSLADDYERLSSGVDDYGNNITLTNEQYEEYKNICQTIAEINPSLIKAYNSEGQAIIEKNDAISKTIELLEEEQKLESAKYTSNKNLHTVVEDAFNDIEDLQEQLNDAYKLNLTDSFGENYEGYINYIQPAIQKLWDNAFKTNTRWMYTDEQRDIIGRLNNIFNGDGSFSENIENDIDGFLELWNSGFDLLKTELPQSGFVNKDTFSNLKDATKDGKKQIAIIQRDINSLYKSFASIGTIYASTSEDFDKLSDEQKSILNSMINAFDYEAMYNEADGDEKKFVADLKSRVNDLITQISSDPEISDLLSQLFKIDSSKLSYTEYSEQIQQIFAKIAETTTGREAGVEIPISLGFTVLKDNKGNTTKIEGEADEIYNNVRERLIQRFANASDTTSLMNRSLIPDKLRELTVDQLRTLYDMEMDDFTSLNQVWESLEGSSGFSLKDYKEEIDKLQETLTTLGGAIDKVSSDSLKAQDTLDLLQEFPELANYDSISEGLMEIAKSKPDALIEKLTKLKESMTGDTTEIDNVIDLIKQMRDEALGLSKDGLIDYGKAKIQKVIDKLEEANKKLESTKEELEKISDKYESAQSAVTTLLEENVNNLKERQTTVKEYYDNQINLLKEENEEREKNIELQEKQKALDDAKRNKVRVYSAARGWTIQTDSEAIAKAQNELDTETNNQQIEALEKKRDAEDKALQKQIDADEKYIKLWEDALKNNSDSLADQKAARQILGEGWKEAVENGDTAMLKKFVEGYEANEKQVFSTEQKIADNNDRIKSLNEATETIEGVLTSEDSGLNAIWNLLNPTQLSVDNIDKSLSEFTTWLGGMLGNPSTEGVEAEQARQDALAEEARQAELRKQEASVIKSSLDLLGIDPRATSMIEKLMSTAPGSAALDNLNRLNQSQIKPLSMSTVNHQGNFAPNIVNNFNGSEVTADLIKSVWKSIIDGEYSAWLVGNR